MDQSTVFVGALVGGFVLYLAANQRFGAYLNVLWPRPVATQAGPSAAVQNIGTNLAANITSPFNIINPFGVLGLFGSTASANQAGW